MAVYLVPRVSLGFQCGVAWAAAKLEIFSTKSTTTPILGKQEGRREDEDQNFGSMSKSPPKSGSAAAPANAALETQ